MKSYVKIRLPMRHEDGSLVYHTLMGKWLLGFGDFQECPLLGLTATYRERKQWGDRNWFVIRSASKKLVVYQKPLGERDRPEVAIYDSFEAMQPHLPPSVFELTLERAGLAQPEKFPEVPLDGV